MALSLDEMLAQARIERETLIAWIEEGWVAPTPAGDDYSFEEVDVARVGFILELTRDLEIGEEAVPVVLSLVDQLNALHATMHKVLEATQELPEPGRSRILALLDAPEPD